MRSEPQLTPAEPVTPLTLGRFDSAGAVAGEAQTKERIPRSILVLIAGLTVFYILFGYLVHAAQPDWLFSLDPDGLARIGRNLCFGHGFAITRGTPTVFRGPAYPGALAFPCWITGVDPAQLLPLVNGLCQFITLLVLARHPLGRLGKARVAALLAVGLDPLLLNYSGRAYLEPMLILAVALVIAGIDRLVKKPTPTSMAVLGLTWGFSLLVKPVLIYLVVAMVPVLLLVSRRTAALAVGSFAIALLVISPWTARNFALTGRMIPVSTGGWLVMLKGDTFARFVTQSEGVEELEDKAKADLDTIDHQRGIVNLPDYEREVYYQQEVMQRIRKEPRHLPTKVAIQSIDFWILGGDRHKTLVFALLQVPALLLFAIAAREWQRSNPRALLGVGIVGVYLMGVYALSLAIARYSMPLRPWIVLAAISFVTARIGARRPGLTLTRQNEAS